MSAGLVVACLAAAAAGVPEQFQDVLFTEPPS